MKKYLHPFLFIGLAILASCGSEDTPLPAPDASFFVQPSPVHVGDAVVFVNTSTNASDYEWDFGDGQVVTQVSPIVTFETIGIVTVTLTAMSEDGQEDDVSQIITVLEAEPDPTLVLPTPDADFFTDSGVVEVGIAVMFENQTINASSYLWDFGNGETSTDISPTTTYTERGTYKVKLIATTDDNQNVTLEKDVVVLERVFTAYFINIFPILNGEESWDPTPVDPDDSFADIVMLFGANSDTQFDNLLIDGLLPGSGAFNPLFGSVDDDPDDGLTSITLTNETWTFSLDDFDGDFEDINGTLDQNQPMAAFAFNPVTAPTIKSENGKSGFISIFYQNPDTDDIVDIDLAFVLE